MVTNKKFTLPHPNNSTLNFQKKNHNSSPTPSASPAPHDLISHATGKPPVLFVRITLTVQMW